MEYVLKGIGYIVIFLVVLGGLAILLAFPTMWAVNYLFAPSLLTLIFGVAKFNFWRALVFNFIVGTPFLRGAGKSKD